MSDYSELYFQAIKAVHKEEITLPEQVSVIPREAFRDTTGIERVVIPTTVTSIEAGAFFACGDLREIYFEGPVENIHAALKPEQRVLVRFSDSIPKKECKHMFYLLTEQNAQTAVKTQVSTQTRSAGSWKRRAKDIAKYGGKDRPGLSRLALADELTERLAARFEELLTALQQEAGLTREEACREFPLGLLYVTDEEYEGLTALAEKYVNKQCSLDVGKAFVCSLFLVATVQRRQQSDQFWEPVCTALSCGSKGLPYLKEALLMFCTAQGLYFHYYDNGKHAYEQTAQIHAIMRRGSIRQTVDLVDTFYEEIMGGEYSDSPQYPELFLRYMCEDLSREEESTLSAYQVLKPFKMACRLFPNVLKRGITCLLLNLDGLHRATGTICYTPRVFRAFFRDWLRAMTVEDTLAPLPLGLAVHRRIAPSALNPSPRFGYARGSDNTLRVLIPQVEVERDDARKVLLRLYSDNVRVYQSEVKFETRGVFRQTLRVTEPVILPCFYKRLRVRLLSARDEKVLLDSGAEMFREYLLFDSQGRESENVRGSCSIVAEEDVPFVTAQDYKAVSFGNYRVYTLDAAANTEVSVGGHMVLQSAAARLRLAPDERGVLRNVKAIRNGREYLVYRKFPLIHVRKNDDVSLSDYDLLVNGRRIGAEVLYDRGGRDIARMLAEEDTPFADITLVDRSGNPLAELRLAVFWDFRCGFRRAEEGEIEITALSAEGVRVEGGGFPRIFKIPPDAALLLHARHKGTPFQFAVTLPALRWELSEGYGSGWGTKYVPVSAVRETPCLHVFAPFGTKLFLRNGLGSGEEIPLRGAAADLSAVLQNHGTESLFVSADTGGGEERLFEIVRRAEIRDFAVSVQADVLQMTYWQSCAMTLRCEARCLGEKDSEPIRWEHFVMGSGDVTLKTRFAHSPGLYSLRRTIIPQEENGGQPRELPMIEFVSGDPFALYLRSHPRFTPHEVHFDRDESLARPCGVCGDNFWCTDFRPLSEGCYEAAAHSRAGANGAMEHFPVYMKLLEKNGNKVKMFILDSAHESLYYDMATGRMFYTDSELKDHRRFDNPDHCVTYLDDSV